MTIEIKYTMLFKHCTTCGMLSHEKSFCPTNDVKCRIQPMARPDVFTQMQLPNDEVSRQQLTRNAHARDQYSYQSSRATNDFKFQDTISIQRQWRCD